MITLQTEFEVLDALSGHLTEDYSTDVKRASSLGYSFSEKLYWSAVSMQTAR